MNRKERAHLIDAVATYVCRKAKEENRILTEIKTEDFAKQLGANYEVREQAYKRAREIMRDFY